MTVAVPATANSEWLAAAAPGMLNHKEVRMRFDTVLTFLVCLISFTAAADLTGRVVAISDGDTLTLLTPENSQVKIRLAEIDTPESAQPYGSKAKQALSSLAFNKQVTAKVETTDRYGRKVAHVYAGDTWVNAELVSSGAAWVYRQYSDDPKLLAMESEARAAKRGLWSLPESEQTPPWEWRKNKRAGAAVATTGEKSKPKPSSLSGFTCESKRYCKQMTSCEEAKFYLNECGVHRLDRDKDGIPCESLCR